MSNTDEHVSVAEEGASTAKNVTQPISAQPRSSRSVARRA